MAWRPHKYLIEGELDNTVPGKVTGWMRFVGMNGKVTFDLAGDFHRDIRGVVIRLRGQADGDEAEAKEYFKGFAVHQTGKAGDITGGREPADYVSYPYIEWYGDRNGRVVIELEPADVEVIGEPIPASECEPIAREEQNRNFQEFLVRMARDLSQPTDGEENEKKRKERGRKAPDPKPEKPGTEPGR